MCMTTAVAMLQQGYTGSLLEMEESPGMLAAFPAWANKVVLDTVFTANGRQRKSKANPMKKIWTYENIGMCTLRLTSGHI